MMFAVIVKAQDPPPDELVFCYAQVESCTGSSVAATISDCCDHSVTPMGFAYERDGIEGCFFCPVSKYNNHVDVVQSFLGVV